MEDKRSFAERFQRIHAGLHKGSVEDFLADCRADKERELAIEKRQEEDRVNKSVAATVGLVVSQ